jgi:hypothetical protein
MGVWIQLLVSPLSAGMAEMDLFLLVLQCGGISIALVGWRRECWLRRRRR